VLVEEPHKYTRSWNSEAPFVVAGANDCSKWQQMDIFDHSSKWRIYNLIIVSQEHDVIDKTYSRPKCVNDIDTGMKMRVYTWFPYQSSVRCTEVNDITLLDSWVISAQGHFTNNTDLFPRKISDSLNGCPMNACVRDGIWCLRRKYIQYNDSKVNVRFHITGFEFDLVRVVLQQMNMSFSHITSTKV